MLPIACTLSSLDENERRREAVLLAELVALEHRCCPFLDFALEWPSGGEPWLHIGRRGGEGGDGGDGGDGELVKDFVRRTFLAAV